MDSQKKIKELKRKSQYSSIMLVVLLMLTSLQLHLDSTRYNMFILANIILILFYIFKIVKSIKEINVAKKIQREE